MALCDVVIHFSAFICFCVYTAMKSLTCNTCHKQILKEPWSFKCPFSLQCHGEYTSDLQWANDDNLKNSLSARSPLSIPQRPSSRRSLNCFLKGLNRSFVVDENPDFSFDYPRAIHPAASLPVSFPARPPRGSSPPLGCSVPETNPRQ